VNIRKITLSGLFVALIVIGAFIKIPVPVVPFTLQFLFTMLAGLLLGGKNGAFCVFAYMLLGLAGLPVFAEGGGPAYIFKPSFGYMPGFILGTYVTGTMVEHFKENKFIKLLLANFTGLLLVYLVGMVYYFIICNYVINTPIGVWPLFLYCFLLAVPGDIVLCFVGAAVAVKLRPILKRMGE